jgi:ABC-type nitrate/sulfonate/bicarbonate transport system substrate-binding protein
VRTPADFPGKKVGIQATGVILLHALLAKNKIDPKEVEVVTIGSDMMPLMTGQVDVVTGWVTNTTALKVLGPDRVELRLWDTGVRLYANPYYATTQTLSANRDLLVRFMRAASRGWAYAYANPDQAIQLAAERVSQPQCCRRARCGGCDAVVLLRHEHQDKRLRYDGPEDLAGPNRHLEPARPVLQAHPKA